MKFEYTVTAKSVEDAYSKAVSLYSSVGEIVNTEIICEGKKGFLGIFGSQPAEIKVTVDDGRPERAKPVEKKQEKKPEPKKEAPKQAPQQEKKPQQNNNKQNNKKHDKKPEKKQAPKAETVKEPIKDEDIKVTASEKSLAIGFIRDFIASIGFKCEVVGDLTPDENGYVSRLVTVEGEGASTLIGHHGETLDAIQYLANLCLARKSDTDHKEYVKVVVDIENYRAKREQTLRALARKMADKALRQNRNIHLDPMNPYERRIIHSEVQKIEGVSTHSVGYDETRKIVITVDKK
ncbi:MAG: KH domain-containing protein [Ruminococcaceae bacterium]|nr:KH domain-containing protein [Oscillospiraceae bacterium]